MNLIGEEGTNIWIKREFPMDKLKELLTLQYSEFLKSIHCELEFGISER